MCTGRASGGVYTGTNPDCAKQCVAKGAKIVLIVPDKKRILIVANQAAAKGNIGDYVEVTGEVDPGTKPLRIDSLKMLAEGRAMCDPASKFSQIEILDRPACWRCCPPTTASCVLPPVAVPFLASATMASLTPATSSFVRTLQRR